MKPAAFDYIRADSAEETVSLLAPSMARKRKSSPAASR
ncbi:MAG: hypothetical protein JWR65_4214 [Massilia sp.]|nr:hypothetical protein [Massilia sp.]